MTSKRNISALAKVGKTLEIFILDALGISGQLRGCQSITREDFENIFFKQNPSTPKFVIKWQLIRPNSVLLILAPWYYFLVTFSSTDIESPTKCSCALTQHGLYGKHLAVTVGFGAVAPLGS